jgi:chromosome segregation ATPase
MAGGRMTLFNRKKEDKIFQDGKLEGSRETLEEYKGKLEDQRNYYEGELSKRDFEITRLNLQLKTWKAQHEVDLKKESDLKKRESQLRSEIYNLEKYKDMLRDRLYEIMKEQVDGTQELLAMIGEKKQLEGK